MPFARKYTAASTPIALAVDASMNGEYSLSGVSGPDVCTYSIFFDKSSSSRCELVKSSVSRGT